MIRYLDNGKVDRRTSFVRHETNTVICWQDELANELADALDAANEQIAKFKLLNGQQSDTANRLDIALAAARADAERWRFCVQQGRFPRHFRAFDGRWYWQQTGNLFDDPVSAIDAALASPEGAKG